MKLSKMNRKYKLFFYNFIKNDGLYCLIALFVLAVIYFYVLLFGKSKIELFDWTIFFSLIATGILNWFAIVLKKKLLNSLEDGAKLCENYDLLLNQYVSTDDEQGVFLTYNNSKASSSNLKKIAKLKSVKQKNNIVFPIIVCAKLNKVSVSSIIIRDRASTIYEPPEIITKYYGELLSAHETSSIYNQLCIRVDDWHMDNNVFTLHTSRTTYFHSMVTNRAMDYQFNRLSVRSLFEYGPFISTLSESKLSNHLGFNGFISSSDSFIILVLRSKKLSIGKDTLGCSINASVKAKYALDKNKEMTTNGLIDCINMEIQDELKIPVQCVSDVQFISAYRDIVEGGKPQLLFYAKAKDSLSEIISRFRLSSKKSAMQNAIWPLEDGKVLLSISEDELLQGKMALFPSMMVRNGRIYKMLPSVSGSLAMLIDFLHEKNSASA